MLCTLVAPTGGSAQVAGFDVDRERDNVRRNIGLVFQDTTLDTYLSAEQNLRLHAELYGVPREINRPAHARTRPVATQGLCTCTSSSSGRFAPTWQIASTRDGRFRGRTRPKAFARVCCFSRRTRTSNLIVGTCVVRSGIGRNCYMEGRAIAFGLTYHLLISAPAGRAW